MKISIIGSGYVGLVTGTCFAELGNRVTFVDILKEKVDKINSGISPIYEEKLDKMLTKNIRRGRVRATTHLEKAVLETNLTFIVVGTPSNSDGSIDLIYIKKTAEEIGKALAKKDEYHTDNARDSAHQNIEPFSAPVPKTVAYQSGYQPAKSTATFK